MPVVQQRLRAVAVMRANPAADPPSAHPSLPRSSSPALPRIYSSGNGHNLRGSYSGTTASDRRPQAVWSQAPAMRVINFDRQTARWMAAGSDAINLGGATAFSMYAETLLTTSAPGIVAGEGGWDAAAARFA